MSSSSSSSTSTSTDPFFSGEPSSNPNNNTGNAASSSSLYLFTFLATLLLLLLISCGIVFRSIAIRRRYRRRVEQAIEAGVIPPYPGPGGAFDGLLAGRHQQRKRDFGARPEIFDTWVGQPVPSEEANWAGIQPVSVKFISDAETDGHDTMSTSDRPSTPSQGSDANPAPRRFLAALNPFTSSHQRSPSPSSLRAASPVPLLSPNHTMEVEGEGEGPLALQPEPPAKKLEVAVLIAMPSPYRPQAWTSDDASTDLRSRMNDNDREEDVPDVVFGVAEVPVTMRVRAEAGGPAEVEGHELE